MKRREGLIRVRSLCHRLSNSGEGGIPQLRRLTCLEGSLSVDVSPPVFRSDGVDDISDEGVRDRVLTSRMADLRFINFKSSSATCPASLSGFPHVGSLFCNPVISLVSPVHVFNSSFRVSAVPFATLRELWKEDKEERGADRHDKHGASEPWSSERPRITQIMDSGRGVGSEKRFVTDTVPESDVLISNEKAMNNILEDELGCVMEEAKTDARWSEMGWSREEILNWPNAVSMARLLSGPLLSWMILHELWTPALVGLLIAGISDWLDGHLARKMDVNSVLGSYLDPVADKFLVGSVGISMAYMGLLHPTLVGLIVARDMVLVGGAFIYRAYTLRWQWNDWQEFFRISNGGVGKVQPLSISKVNTVFQLALVGVALLQPALSIEDKYLVVPVLSLSVVVTTSISWMAYVYVYWKNPESLAVVPHVAHARCPKTPEGSS